MKRTDDEISSLKIIIINYNTINQNFSFKLQFYCYSFFSKINLIFMLLLIQ